MFGTMELEPMFVVEGQVGYAENPGGFPLTGNYIQFLDVKQRT